MRLFKIKDKEMFNSTKKKKQNGNHTYAVYHDRKTNEYRAIQLTHLYDPKKESEILRGTIKKIKLKNYKFPSSIPNQYYTKDIEGNSLDFGKNTKHLEVGKVSFFQSQKIKKFAKINLSKTTNKNNERKVKKKK
ncbi:MAG: hypothetical protein IJX17_06500 [Clostridia bacterium]|nr:hypothetical protein [Clostridia bacterium]